MAKRKLSQDEINQALTKVRSKYDDYIIEFMKPLSIKEDFEDRYLEALRQRRNIALFFQEELIFLNSLVEKEKAKQIIERRKADSERQRLEKRKKEASLADRVMEEHRKRIEKYPSIAPENYDIGYEMQKLFGALEQFEKELWLEIEAEFRRFHGRMYNPLRYIQSRLYDMLRKSVDDLPQGMSRYMTVLDRIPRVQNDVDIENNRCLVEVAGLLHNVSDELDELLKQREPQPETARKLEYLRDRTFSIISDFRMKDLKPNNRR